jgi:hypothetical protein
LPRQYPKIGFQCCQKPANDLAPKECRSMFRSEPAAPKGTPFFRLTYSANVSFLCLAVSNITLLDDCSDWVGGGVRTYCQARGCQQP